MPKKMKKDKQKKSTVSKTNSHTIKSNGSMTRIIARLLSSALEMRPTAILRLARRLPPRIGVLKRKLAWLGVL